MDARMESCIYTGVFNKRICHEISIACIDCSTDFDKRLAAGHDWSGAYLGGQMGYASGTSRYSSDIDEQLKFSPDGFLGGIYGYNHQFSNNMVLGLDADFSLANIKNNGKYYDGGIRDPEVGTSIKMRWNGAADPRRLCSIGSCRTSRRVFPMGKLSVWDEAACWMYRRRARAGPSARAWTTP